MVLQEKGRMIAILPASSFNALIFEMKNHIGKTLRI